MAKRTSFCCALELPGQAKAVALKRSAAADRIGDVQLIPIASAGSTEITLLPFTTLPFGAGMNVA
jgi:hypothetical protein